jgi:acyl dehydratase
VCGFAADGPVPATYPQVLAFPLLLDLMTSGGFPFPAVGAVHVSNSIVQDRVLHESESLELSVSVTDVIPHRRGLQATVVTEAHVEAEAVWRATSMYLGSRGTGTAGDPAQSGSAPPVAATEALPVDAVGEDVARPAVTVLDRQPWHLPADLGRRYAAASGDCNPIHLSAITARPFGFRSPIAHGMWTVARALSQLEDLLIHPPGRLRCDVAFKRPLPLPSTVLLSAYVSEELHRADGGMAEVAAPLDQRGPVAGPIEFRVEAAGPAARRSTRGRDSSLHDPDSPAGPRSEVHLEGRLVIGC